MSITEALELGGGDICSIVGGGGKTSLIHALAHENFYKRTVVTTTTKMWDPRGSRHPYRTVFAGDVRELSSQDPGGFPILVAGDILLTEERGRAKVTGLSDGAVDILIKTLRPRLLLVEADGSAGRSLKMPADYEPPIPPLSTMVCGVIGLDCLGKRASADTIHRFPLVRERIGLSPGQVIGAEHLRLIINHREGLFKNCPPGAERVVILNKADRFSGEAEELCEALLRDTRRDIRIFLTDLSDYTRPGIWPHPRKYAS